MNASSREVLKEVRFGLLIMEPDMRRSGVKRSECLGTKRVLGWSIFLFRCHDATNQKKERGGKKDTQKSTNTINISKYKELKVRIHEKCMSMWYAIVKTSWAQPKCNVIMHMWCNVRCLKVIFIKPIPKISQKLHQFWKPQSLSRIPKVRSENMNCMIEWVKKSILEERRWSWGRKTLGKGVWSERNVFGRWEDTKVSREIKENEIWIAKHVFIGNS